MAPQRRPAKTRGVIHGQQSRADRAGVRAADAGRHRRLRTAHARSELARLKRLLGRQGLLDLLHDENAEGNRTLRHHAIDSAGVMASGTTELRVTGLEPVALLTWLQQAFDREPVLLAAEPDHYGRVEKLVPGQPVELDIALSPVGLSFRAGQQLRLVVSGRELLGPMMPALAGVVPANEGRQVLLTGPSHDSWLQLPVMDADA